MNSQESVENGKAAVATLSADEAIIDNGTVQLGVNDTGNLDVSGGSPSSGTGTTFVGLRYMPTNAESTAPGCLCEGWGAADAISGVTGSADEAFGAPVNMTVDSFTSTASTAVSTVTIGSTLQVTHAYHPSPQNPNLYEVTVTIENLTAAAVDLRYRRVMDWDIEPTAFSENVTVATGTANTTLLYNNNDGFTRPDPLGAQTSGQGSVLPIVTGSFTDAGPRDHGALFDFGFGSLPANATKQFVIYYGAAATEAGALAALSAVGAGVYSIAEPGTTAGRDNGTPNTFMFGFSDLYPVEPAPPGTEPNENGATGGDPVQTFSGAFQYAHTDVAVPGRGPAPSFTRSYSSADTRTGRLGPGWTDNYAARLRSPGDATADLLLVNPDGNTDRYTANPDGTFSPPAASYATLTQNPDGSFTVTQRDQSRWVFSSSGNLASVSDRYGDTSTLTYNGNGQLIAVSDPAGRGSLSLGYTSGRLTSVTDWASPVRTVTYQYDASGRLWKVTDREGKTTTFGYDGTSARVTTITDARANVALTLTYDAQGRVATQKDARGLTTGDVTTFAYVVNGDGTRVTTITGPVTSFEPSFHPTLEDTYNTSGWLTRRISKPSSTETLTETYGYDSIGNGTSATDPRGGQTNLCFDVSYAGGAISGSRGNLTRVIAPAPTAGASRPVTLLAYDVKNNLVQSVPPKGVPSGATVTCSTDLSAVTNAYATDLGYDASATKLLSTTSRFTDPDTGPTASTTKYEYGDVANPGLVTKVVPGRGNTAGSPDYTYARTLTYFASGSKAGLLERVVDPLGGITSYDYDAVGRVIAVVDPNGNVVGGVPSDYTTQYVYDKEDRTRFVKQPAPAAGGAQLVTETRFDDVGNPVVRIDAAGQVMSYLYDARDGLFQVKESPNAWSDPTSPPAGVITTEYAYDAGGNLTRMTRAKGDTPNERAADYAFDGRGLVRRESQYPSWPATTPSLVTVSSYDANGNPATLVDPLGQTTTSGYDALNRLTSIDYSAATTPDVAYSYDENGNRTSMTDGTGSTSYVYDEADHLTSVASPGPKIVAYRYDLDGNRTKLIYPDATAITYSFDKAGQLASLVDWASRTTSYTYLANGAVKNSTSINGTVATYGYDNASRVTSINHAFGAATIDQRSYTLDPVGNVLAVAGGSTADTTARVSESTTHGQGNGVSDDSYISADGRYVTFRSTATTLVTGDTNGVMDVFVHDRLTGTTTRASLDAAGVQGNAQSDDSAISAGGRYVVFKSQASNFVAGDTNGTSWDIFVKDLQTGAISRVSTSSAGAQSNGASHDPVISADGRYVAYRSSATNLVAGDTNGQQDIFVKDNQTGTTTRVSLSTGGVQGNALADDPNISDDGRYVAFHSDATNLVTGDTNAARDVFIRDRTANTTVRASVSTAGTQGNGASSEAAVSGDGSTVAYQSVATNLVASDTNAKTDVFVRVIATGVTTRASVSNTGAQATNSSEEPSLSRDGTAVAFDSLANNLVTGDTNSRKDIFIRNTAAGSTVRMSLSTAGVQGNDTSRNATVAGEGRTVAFESDSTNLITGDTNGTQDVFVRGPGVDASTYGYDRLSRLTSANGPDGSRSYAYDPAGNRSSKVLAGATTTYSYDRADRITAAGALSITVNANGNTTAKGADTFTYDQPNRLKTATISGATETYAYDGDGTRFSRQVGSGTPIRYVSDVNRRLPVMIDDGTRKYVWGLGLAYAVAGATIEVYHPDRLGSVRAISDATGGVAATYRTDEWGAPTTTSGSSTQPFRFTGELQDGTGLIYLRARYYDPSLGRFGSRDEWPGGAARPLSLNRYGYVFNNPQTLRDPNGRTPTSDVLGGVLIQTVGLCFNGIAGAGLFASVSACQVKDVTGATALLISAGPGSMAGMAASLTGGPFFANSTIPNLGDWFQTQGGSASIAIYTGGVDVANTPGWEVWTAEVLAGVSLPLPIPAEYHLGATYTWILEGVEVPLLPPLSSWELFADAFFLAQQLAN